MASSAPRVSVGIRISAVVVLSAVLGGLTSLAQTVLPEAVVSFANSASGWTLLTALTAIAETTSPVYWIVMGALGVALVAWALVARVRGRWPVAILLAGTTITAIAFVAAYTWIGGSG